MIHVDVGAEPVDLYDTVGEVFLARGATGVTSISIPSHTPRVVVNGPADGAISYPKPYQMAINGVIVDYLANQCEQYRESFENGWPAGAVACGAEIVPNDAFDGAKSLRLKGQDSLTIPISTVGLLRLEVSYTRRLVSVPDLESDFLCEFHDSRTWRELEHKVGAERAPGVTWKMNYIDLPQEGENNADFQLRFRVNYEEDAAFVDNVVVRAVRQK
ncbi:MAG: hypothetical protein NTW86_24810 [Candidatus Sumerlaeota bacterium]|nr:hypothetical protein [Candidatus Sumerlaeota bacterium]